MAKRSYPIRRYPKYRTALNASGASVAISELKENPIKFIYAAESRPIKILRYGHIAALIITPEFYDSMATELEDARAEVGNLRALLNTISPDLLRFWEHMPADLVTRLSTYTDSSSQVLPKLARDYVLGVEEILDDLQNESDDARFASDPNFKRLADGYRKSRAGNSQPNR